MSRDSVRPCFAGVSPRPKARETDVVPGPGSRSAPKPSDGRIWIPNFEGVAILDPRRIISDRQPGQCGGRISFGGREGINAYRQAGNFALPRTCDVLNSITSRQILSPPANCGSVINWRALIRDGLTAAPSALPVSPGCRRAVTNFASWLADAMAAGMRTPSRFHCGWCLVLGTALGPGAEHRNPVCWHPRRGGSQSTPQVPSPGGAVGSSAGAGERTPSYRPRPAR